MKYYIMSRISLLICCCFIAQSIQATTFTAIADGNWASNDVWDLGYAPNSASDTIVIDGYFVGIDDETMTVLGVPTIFVSYLRLTNDADLGTTHLFVQEEGSLEVTGDLDAVSYDKGNDVLISLTNLSSVVVGGNASLIRTVDNNRQTCLQLHMANESEFEVQGNLTYDYLSADVGEVCNEIVLTNESELIVQGDTEFTIQGGNDFDFQMGSLSTASFNQQFSMSFEGGDNLNVVVADSAELFVADSTFISNNATGVSGEAMLSTGVSGGKITISETLVIESTEPNEYVSVKSLGGEGEINVIGDITMKATDAGDVRITLDDESELNIGGNFNRPTDFGDMNITNGGQLIYNGTAQQTIASDELPNNGSDSFDNSNVKFANTSGLPMLLEGKMVVEDSLILGQGIIQTANIDDIVIKDAAMIKGGSATSYIDGPITKEGTSNGEPFVFPVGDNGVYAPIEITPISQSGSIFVADYMACPPPYVDAISGDLTRVSNLEHWILERTGGTEAVDVSLHWINSASSGIDDPNSLVVAELNPNTNTWESRGNGGVIAAGSGQPTNSIINDNGCPPPYIELFTFGSTSETANALPVELLRFKAKKDNDFVQLAWYTESEVNTDHFVLEHSPNGVTFEPIEKIPAQGNSIERTTYKTTDFKPFKGINYYRLLQVDLDGRSEYSDFTVVNFISDDIATVFPNPVYDAFKVSIGEETDEPIQLAIINQQGQVIYQGVHRGSGGYLRLSTSAVNIRNVGTYYLSILFDGKRISRKFISL